MVRSLWKGKYINYNYTHIWFNFSNQSIILFKNNQYIFSEFKHLYFKVYRGDEWKSFFILDYFTGFIIGVFLITREKSVRHNVKKSKKQRAKEQQRLAKRRKNKTQKLHMIKKEKLKKKKIKHKSFNFKNKKKKKK